MLNNKGIRKLVGNNKDDEWFTFYEDIEKEVSFYLEHNKDLFRGKVVLCPCDDYRYSNFTKYFKDNFERFGLKKLVCTCYEETATQLSMFSEMKRATKYVKDEKGENITLLQGNGDFRSEEVSSLRDECDYIITNPPFSLMDDFIPWCINKKFLIIMPFMSVTHAKVFPFYFHEKIQLGRNLPKYFFNKDKQKVVHCWWIQNIEKVGKEKLQLKTMEENGIDFQKYDNLDAIDIPSVKLIPKDYKGKMGVPINFLEYDAEGYDILGIANNILPRPQDGLLCGKKIDLETNEGVIKYSGFVINGKACFMRIIIKKKDFNALTQ